MNVPRVTADLIHRVASQPGAAPIVVAAPVYEPDLSWRNTLWHSAGGAPTPISELADSHLRNIIFYLHRETGYKLKMDDYTMADIIDHNCVWAKREAAYELVTKEAAYRNLSWI